MDAVSLTVGLSWMFSGALFMALCLPLARGRVRRNAFYGVRLRQSLESDHAWDAINRFGGRRMAMWSIPMILSGVVALFVPLQHRTALALTFGLGPLVFMLIPLIEILHFARTRQTER